MSVSLPADSDSVTDGALLRLKSPVAAALLQKNNPSSFCYCTTAQTTPGACKQT